MERAAAALLEPLSVGVRIDISHVSPTPVGAAVRSHAGFPSREDALFRLNVWSEGPGGIIGKGAMRERFMDVARIEETAASRHPKPRLPDEEKDV